MDSGISSDEEPIYTAVIYDRHLINISIDEPLHGLHYYGQSVRALGTVLEIAKDRWNSEFYEAMREHKVIGLLACLELFGADAFADRVVDWKTGPRSIVQKWADEQETRLIKEGGGVLRDPFTKLTQTLNLTHGGKPACAEGRTHCYKQFAAMDALRTVAWQKFKKELLLHVEVTGSANCLTKTIADSGYRIGNAIQSVRKGHLWKGHPSWEERVRWLESLSGWEWKSTMNARQIDWLKFQSEMMIYVEANETSLVPQNHQSASEYILGTAVSSVRRGGMLTNHPDKDARVSWLESLPGWIWNAQRTEAFSQQHREIGLAQFEREKAEGKPTVVDHGKRTRTDSWTPEQRRVVLARRAATAVAKRDKVLAELSDDERKKKQAEYDRTDRKEANRRGKANALLQLPEYADKDYQWAYRNLPQASKDGVVFFQDAEGAWCVRAGGQGGAGSSE